MLFARTPVEQMDFPVLVFSTFQEGTLRIHGRVGYICSPGLLEVLESLGQLRHTHSSKLYAAWSGGEPSDSAI